MRARSVTFRLTLLFSTVSTKVHLAVGYLVGALVESNVIKEDLNEFDGIRLGLPITKSIVEAHHGTMAAAAANGAIGFEIRFAAIQQACTAVASIIRHDRGL